MKIAVVLIGLSLAGAWISTPGEQVATVAVRPTATLENKAIPKAVPPAGLPASFKVRFVTSAGETINTVADYVTLRGTPEPHHVWRTPAVKHTIDHPSLDTAGGDPFVTPPIPYFSSLGPKVITSPVDVIYYPILGYSVLRVGTEKAFVDSWPSLPDSAFNLPFGEFGMRSVRYTAISVGP